MNKMMDEDFSYRRNASPAKPNDEEGLHHFEQGTREKSQKPFLIIKSLNNFNDRMLKPNVYVT